MLPERKTDTDLLSPAGRMVGVRGPGAAQRARALHLAAVADATPAAAEDPAADTHPAAEPLAEPEVARRTPAADVKAPDQAAGGPSRRRFSRKQMLLGAVAAIAVAAGGWFGAHYMTVGRYMVSTDDAYVH